MPEHENYRLLIDEVRGLLSGEKDYVANAANLSALVYRRVEDVNWVGFYFLRGNELVVGPFAGQPACTRIAVGRGVCGTAVAQNKMLCIDNVHDFSGHIACDPDSRSEIVVPLQWEQRVIGVLDIDSPTPARFGEAERRLATALAAVYIGSIEPADLLSE